jgi:Zn-finger nucleic acid-binding protein
LLITERQGIEIDYCPQCRGIWLDRGELDKLIEKSAVEPARLRYAEDDDRYKQTHPEYRKRKKSFLGEIFDFD